MPEHDGGRLDNRLSTACCQRAMVTSSAITAETGIRASCLSTTFATNSIGTKSKHTSSASVGIALSVVLSCSCARMWSVTVQSATPTCIWNVPASWIFTALVVTMLSGPCKAMSASCFQYFLIFLKSKFMILHLLL